LNVKVVPNDNF